MKGCARCEDVQAADRSAKARRVMQEHLTVFLQAPAGRTHAPPTSLRAVGPGLQPAAAAPPRRARSHNTRGATQTPSGD